MQTDISCGCKRLFGVVAQATKGGVLLAAIGGAILFLGLTSPAYIFHDSQTGQASTSPVVLDAPARTVALAHSTEQEIGRAGTTTAINPAGDVVILDDWNYTAIVRGRPQPSRAK